MSVIALEQSGYKPAALEQVTRILNSTLHRIPMTLNTNTLTADK